MISGLNDGVLLSVKTTAEFMSLTRGDGLLLTKATDFEAVFQSSGSAIVTRGQNLLVFDEEGAHLSPETRRTFSHQMGYIHKILFPARPGGDSPAQSPAYRRQVCFIQVAVSVDASRPTWRRARHATARSATDRRP